MSGSMPLHPQDEERAAAEMARELETLTMTSSVVPSEGFGDRVMAAIASEPLPQPVRAFGIALLAGRLRAAGGAVRDAARLVTVPRVPVAVRAQAFALVLVVTAGSLLLAGGAAIGVGALFAGTPPTPTPAIPSPSLPAPAATPSPTMPPEASPSETADPSETVEPSETPEASDTPEPTDDHTARPTATGTDDHGGGGSGEDSGSGSGSSGSSGSGSGSGGGETPQPTGTDDHGGGSDG
jgi:uncharacterized membrane protein YgcG